MRRLVLTVFLVVGLAAPIWAHLALAQDTFPGQVVHVADGDTLSVLPDNSDQPVTVRLYVIDCPEKGQPWGARAKQFTEAKCLGKNVLVFGRDVDQYGRLVAKVMLCSQRILNHLLLQDGLAFWYEKHTPDETLYRTLEKHARRDKKGLWVDPEPVPLWEWRKIKAKGEIPV